MLDFSKRDQLEYGGLNLYRSLEAAAQGKPIHPIFKDVSEDLAKTELGKQFITQPGAFIISMRALTATGSFASGGALVETGPQGQQVVGALRSAPAVFMAGAERIDGVEGTLAIPLETTAPTFSTYHETEDVTASDSVIGQLTASPHRVSANVVISRQLDTQSGDLLGRYLDRTLQEGSMAEHARLALVGTGADGECAGVFNMAGTGTVTFSGASTHAKVLDFQTQCVAAKANDGALAWVGHQNVRAKWRALQRFTGVSDTLWNCDSDEINGRPAYVSQDVSSTAGIILGDWSYLKMVTFGKDMPLQVIVDPYTLLRADRISLVATLMCDCIVTKPAVFTRAADSAVA